MKKFKRIIALCLCVVICISMSIIAQASYYVNHFTGGNTNGSFTITANSSISQFTVQTQDFDAEDLIIVEVFDSSGKTLISGSVSLDGNEKKENIRLKGTYPKGTYTIRYSAYEMNDSNGGWIGVWLY